MTEAIVWVAIPAALLWISWRWIATRRRKRGASIAGLVPGTPVRYTRHATERMRQRDIDSRQVSDVLAAPERVVPDPVERSVRLERDFGDRVLKVWVADAWPPRGKVVIKSTAWQYAARFTIPAESVARVKGRGGATITKICGDTGAHISVDSGGTVRISAGDAAALEAARRRIIALSPPPPARVGQRFEATVVQLSAHVATVSLPGGGRATLPIAKLRPLVGGRYISDIRDVLSPGQELRVEVDSVRAGRVVLAALPAESKSRRAND